VLLKSDYRARPPATGAPGLCQATAASRIEERVDLTVGRPTDVTLADPLAPRPPNPDASSAEGGGPPLLLGFVRWDPAAGKFAEVFDRANGLGRRYAGVNAAVVAGMGNRLLLQPDAVGASGSLAVELDGAAGELRFGPLVAAGTIADPLLRVDKDGNVKAKGTLSGRAAPGTIHYAGGRASNGLILPLPSGVAEDQVTSGEATLQIVITPHIDPAEAPAGATFWAALTEECRVDDERRLHCRIAWMSLDFAAGPQGATLVSAPGAADYLLVASIASGGA
jgi:hypothetical protein